MSKAISKARLPKGRFEPIGNRYYVRQLRDKRYGVIRDDGNGNTKIMSVHNTEREAEIAARPE